jgi:hypothetical protein
MRRRWPAEPVSWASSEEGSDPTRQLGGAGPGRVPLGRAARHTALAEARGERQWRLPRPPGPRRPPARPACRRAPALPRARPHPSGPLARQLPRALRRQFHHHRSHRRTRRDGRHLLPCRSHTRCDLATALHATGDRDHAREPLARAAPRRYPDSTGLPGSADQRPLDQGPVVMDQPRQKTKMDDRAVSGGPISYRRSWTRLQRPCRSWMGARQRTTECPSGPSGEHFQDVDQ